MNGVEVLSSVVLDTAPRLSVVMPHYNHSEFLLEAIESIVNQSRRPDELIVVDDGSSAESLRDAEAIVARFPEIGLVRHPENLGVNAACQTGLRQVSGEYVAFMAADDRLAPGAIERVACALAQNPTAGLVFSDLAETDEHGTHVEVTRLSRRHAVRSFSPEDFRRVLQRSFFYFGTGSTWFNAATLRAFGGFDNRLRWHADLYVAYGIGMAQGAIYVPDAYTRFRRSSHSYSGGRRGKAQIAVLEAWLAKTREPAHWDARRAFREAAVLPDYGWCAIKGLRSDPNFVTTRLMRRIVSRSIWGWFRPFMPWALRRLARRILNLRA